MPRDPDIFLQKSLFLSKILDNIGVNEDMVKRTRRAWLLRESLTTVGQRTRGFQKTDYIFGSVTEGSTIMWLRSDNDYLMFHDNDEVVCDIKDCTQGKVTLLMSTVDSTPPGYCHLSLVIGSHHDQSSERIIVPHITSTPTYWKSNDGKEYELHGPALSSKGQTNYNDQDYVLAFYCKTWPKAAQKWIVEDGVGQWPTKGMKSFAEHSGCFLVPVGSKGSKMEMYEYRISTSLAERCLMFSLNITQLRCYILMKIILTAFINTEDEDKVVSSYICKNVLFHCVRHTPSTLWKESKLMYCLTLCLSSLQYCVLIGHCPHFIIHDNNLLLGRITSQFRAEFIEIIADIVLSCRFGLIQMVLKVIGVSVEIEMETCCLLDLTAGAWKYHPGVLLRDTGKCIQNFYHMTIFDVNYEDVPVAIKFLYSCVSRLVSIHRLGSLLERLACKSLVVELSSTIGSLLAYRSIMSSSSIPKESLELFDASLDSNVSSNRLKKASVFYSAGKMETASSIITDVEKRYDLNAVEPVCQCNNQPSYPARDGFNRAAERYNENGIKYAVAFCVNFLRCESKCMPKELRLEMYRTTAAEKPLRHLKNQWFDLAIVDSLTYLLFLKYKIFGRLGNDTEQDQAIKDLIRAIYFEPNLGHRETGLNLVGQIMVEKGYLHTALLFFLLSYKVQAKFNAAKIHVCTVLASLVEKYTWAFCEDNTIRVKTVDKSQRESKYKLIRKRDRKTLFF